jgi:BirA family biotin operon repressor/biotin-[acetyl-CoA-carboxylase] ligase
MDEILAFARDGAPEGLVVVADHQSAAHGRAGRTWIAPPGAAILCSILLRPNRLASDLSPLSMLTALAVAETISKAIGKRARIKWPNDVQVDGLKCCGILLRSHMLSGSQHPIVILGIGINVNMWERDLLPGATSLALEAGREFDRDAVLAQLMTNLGTIYDRFLAGDLADDWSRATARLAYLNEAVTIQDGDRVLSGTVRGLGIGGELILSTNNGPLSVVSGNLARGPRPVR